VRATEVGRAHADPRQVRGQVVPALAARNEARLRLFVQQVQRLVAGIERGPARLVHPAAADRLEEVERVRDRRRNLPVLIGERGMPHEIQVPVLGVVQVREAAVDQGAYEIQCQCRAFIPAQQQLGIRLALGRRKARTVDEVAAIAGQGQAVPGLGVGGTRLGVLAGKAAHANHRLLHSVQEHQAHLQQDLELAGDLTRIAVGEGLGAIPALQQEPFTPLRLGDLPLERLDFPGHDDRGQPAQGFNRPRQCHRIPVGRLL